MAVTVGDPTASVKAPRVDTPIGRVLVSPPDSGGPERDVEESSVVKRIKKRIPKQTSETEVQSPGGEDLTQQIEELAEDDFTRYTANFFNWFVRHRTPVIAAVVVVGLAVGITALVTHLQKAGVQEASSAFQDAATAYEKAVEPAPAADDEAGDKPDAKKADDPKARQAHLEKARSGFEGVLKDHADRPVSALATLGLAGVESDLGKPAEAIPHYDQVLARPDLDPFTKVVVLEAKAAAQESAGKTDDAIKTWQAVEGVDKATYGLQARVNVGRLLEAKGDVEGAKKQYEQAKKDFGDVLDQATNRPFKTELERRLAKLGSDA
jgi:tetratricopeptide (TPR) repeat protein